jgi:hypothetical protein
MGYEEVITEFLVDFQAKIAKRDQLRHVPPPARMEQLGFHWTDFHEI